MTVEAWLLTATTLIALVAVVIATLAVRAVRRLSTQVADHAAERPQPPLDVVSIPREQNSRQDSVQLPVELAPRVVEGRVIVPPTQAQVVRTALGRPGVRLSVFAHGLARALRAENRDRIIALMRREYRHRRSERSRAGRHAVRMARPTPAPTTDRLHARLMEPKPVSVTDRMISS
ncbi:MAG TPA: hypothetical protein VM093_08500 [Aeromicrobium sp.]|nr:hypothetical protein [Aeromicrobium sp.]